MGTARGGYGGGGGSPNAGGMAALSVPMVRLPSLVFLASSWRQF